MRHAEMVAEEATRLLDASNVSDAPFELSAPPAALRKLSPEVESLLLTDSISPLPLHKTLCLLEAMEKNWSEHYSRHEQLALARALVAVIGNLRFGPEVGLGKIKPDSAVIGPWFTEVEKIAEDLDGLAEVSVADSQVFNGDSRQMEAFLNPRSLDGVITSPPYPNEKDYTRTTRLETVLLGFVKDKTQLQELKKGLIRSNTRGVYKADDDDLWIDSHLDIQRIAGMIEEKRIEMGKNSGFERLYGRVTKLYFGGMARHMASLRPYLKKGARLAYVVGDQASYLRVMIRTGSLLADIANSLGYEVVGIDLFRTRLATATKQQLREEVLLLRWPN